MKPLLLLLFACVAAHACYSQNISIDTTKFKLDPSYRDRLTSYFERKENENAVISKPLALSNPKPGIHQLPVDNMPVIVPDIKDLAAIPNLWEGEVKVPFTGNQPRIPNAAKPLGFTYRKK